MKLLECSKRKFRLIIFIKFWSENIFGFFSIKVRVIKMENNGVIRCGNINLFIIVFK